MPSIGSKRVVVHLNAPYIRFVLARHDKTQRWMAAKLEISFQYLNQLMSHRRNPSPPLREKIKALFPGRKWDNLFRIAR